MTRRLEDPSHKIMALVDALRVAARTYPGGIPALAQRMGQAASTLYNKFDPGQPQNQPTLADFEEILLLTRAPEVLDAVCAPLGVVWFQLPELDRCTAADLLSAVAKVVAGTSKMTGDLQQAVSDQTVTQGEIDQLERDLYELTKAGRGLVERTRRMMREPGDEHHAKPALVGKGGHG